MINSTPINGEVPYYTDPFVSIEDAFRTAILPHLTGVTEVIFDEQNGPRPNLPYASIKILAMTPVGRVQREFIDDYGKRRFYQHYSVTIRVRIYGSGSIARMNVLSMALCKESVTQYMAANNVAFSTKSSIRKLPELMHASWEERAEMNVTVLSMFTSTEAINNIETINGTLNVESETGFTYSDDFSVVTSG